MKATKVSRNYSLQADIIRIIAAVGVVLIHTVYPVYSRPDFLGGTAWWLAFVLNSASRIAIPLFIMLSGYLMLPKEESPTQNLKRTWQRLVLPLLIWFAIYIWWDARFFHKFHPVIDIISMALMSNIFHLYFLVILAGLYVLLPVWRLMIRTYPDYVTFLTKASVAIGMIYYFIQYTMFSGSSLFNSATIWIPFLGYFLLGHLFSTKKWFSNKKLLILLAAGFAFTLFGNYLNALLQIDQDTFFWRNGVSYFDEPLSPNVFLMSAALFQLLIHNQWLELSIKKIKGLSRVITELSAASFAVYLVHFLVMNVIDYRKGFAIETLQTNLLVYFVVRTTLVVGWSFITAMILTRIPLFKKALGLK
jgi:surface polysaccharide O-acyltransferase-like enzyme